MRQDSSQEKNGQFFQVHFADNVGGTNLSDSVFKIQPNQAAGGYNFNYALTGGITKRMGPTVINSVADTALRTLGMGLYAPASGASKSVIRAADTRLQYFDPSTPSFTNLTADTVTASSAPFTANSTQTVNFSQFNNGVSNILWASGGGATVPVGAYSTSKYTTNGTAAPTGVVTTTVNAHDSGSWPAAGVYYYAIVYRKASTQTLSNAALDVIATTVNTDDSVTLNLTGLTGLDTTLIDQIYIYRSTLAGASAFTTGSLIAQVASSTTTYKDRGPNTDVASAQNIPRAGNVILDNSVLPAGTYNSMTLFKRRLVVAQNSTLYLSDVNKSESWPATNIITVPSAGNITGLAVISFTSPQAQQLDEILVVFKEREVWVLTGSAYQSDSFGNTGWALKFIDQVGCPDQNLVVLANGYLMWIDFRGVYMWDGTSKPIYASRMIEPLFAYGGDLDKTNLAIGCAEFLRRENQVIWYLSSKTYGEQKFALKLDLRLTMPNIEQQLTGRLLDAVFIQDTYAIPIYGALSYIPSGGNQEQLLLGDKSGKVYYASTGHSDGGNDYTFAYMTPPLHLGDPNTIKQYHKVIAWVQDVGTWNLTLDYWSDYHTATAYRTTQALPITTENEQSAALWDIGYWDTSSWDDYVGSVVPIVFNLESGTANTTQGTSLQLQFRNGTQNQPITIHGFSVIYSILGGVTA